MVELPNPRYDTCCNFLFQENPYERYSILLGNRKRHIALVPRCAKTSGKRRRSLKSLQQAICVSLPSRNSTILQNNNLWRYEECHVIHSPNFWLLIQVCILTDFEKTVNVTLPMEISSFLQLTTKRPHLRLSKCKITSPLELREKKGLPQQSLFRLTQDKATAHQKKTSPEKSNQS